MQVKADIELIILNSNEAFFTLKQMYILCTKSISISMYNNL